MLHRLESKARSYLGRFSFSTKGGRCDMCRSDWTFRNTNAFLTGSLYKIEQCVGWQYCKNYDYRRLHNWKCTFRISSYKKAPMVSDDRIESALNLPC